MIITKAELEKQLSAPSDRLIRDIAKINGDTNILS